MNKKIFSKNIEITVAMKRIIDDKFEFLNKFLKDNDKLTITVDVDKNIHRIDLLLTYKQSNIKLTETQNDFYIALDMIVDRLKNTLSKLHDITIEDRKTKDVYSYKLESYQKEETETKGKIMKRKSFQLKPMTEEEAILQMNMLKHETFMFCNADADFIICLLYKRKDGNYGIIESTYDEEDEY